MRSSEEDSPATAGVIYALSDDGETAKVVGYKGTDASVIIATTYQNQPVTSIGASSFFHCNSLTEIKFNGTIEQWNAIEKSERWNNNVPATKVVCNDGEVAL